MSSNEPQEASRRVVLPFRSLVGAIVDHAPGAPAAVGSEACFRALVHHLPEIVVICEADGTIRYHNAAVAPLLGYGPAEVVGTAITTFLHPHDRPALRAIATVLRRRSGGHLTSELRVRHRDGAWHLLEVVVTDRLDDPSVRGLVVLARDRTERRRREAALAYRALHDPLTGLPNRTLFCDRLDHALDRAERQRAPVALLFLDLDRFKTINDTHGHAAGDALLVAVADRLRGSLRRADTLARVGGDEFAVLVEDGDPSTAHRVAAGIGDALQAALIVEGRAVVVTASIGIAVSDPRHRRPDALLRAADQALYRAKAAGGGRAVLFHPDLLPTAAAELVADSSA